jgi:hypothetical protein
MENLQTSTSHVPRPDQIYLDSPIELDRFKIHYTHRGAIYMHQHYQQMLGHYSAERPVPIVQHLRDQVKVIEQCIQYYEALPATANGSPDAGGS